MPKIDLKIEDLVLDGDNPRITHADGYQQALQKVVRDQKTKLVRLAESIVERGLSPLERLMVLEVSTKPKRYIALEGNRRVAVLRLLLNPAAMTGLDMPDGVQSPIEKLAKAFDKSKVEPIEAFEVSSREDGKYWIELRHNGEDEGRGVVGWKPIVAARFRKRGPDIQAFDLVMEHGGFSEDEAEKLRSGFALSTLKRLVDSPEVRDQIGLTMKDGQLHSTMLGSELIKPLKRMVLDISSKKVQSRTFNKKEQMLAYVKGFAKVDQPDFTKKVVDRPIEGIQKAEFAGSGKKGRAKSLKAPERKSVVSRNCQLNVTDNRIGEIYQELRTLRLGEARNAIAVLMRVFLEMSIDHFLERSGVSLKFIPPGGKEQFKKLNKKLAEVVENFVKLGVPKAHFQALTRDLSVKSSPMNIDLFHMYVHDRIATPSPGELTAGWDHAQPIYKKIWP